MPNCSKCGAEIKHDDIFCPKCGTRIPAAAPAKPAPLEEKPAPVAPLKPKGGGKGKLIAGVVSVVVVIIVILVVAVLLMGGGKPAGSSFATAISLSSGNVSGSVGDTEVFYKVYLSSNQQVTLTLYPGAATEPTLRAYSPMAGNITGGTGEAISYFINENTSYAGETVKLVVSSSGSYYYGGDYSSSGYYFIIISAPWWGEGTYTLSVSIT